MAETVWRGRIGGRELTVLRQPDGDGGFFLRVEDGHGLFEISEGGDIEDAGEEAAIHLAEKFARENPPPSDTVAHRAMKTAKGKFWSGVPRLPSMAEHYQAYLRKVEAERGDDPEPEDELDQDMGPAPHR